jgi:hypothetical protein
MNYVCVNRVFGRFCTVTYKRVHVPSGGNQSGESNICSRKIYRDKREASTEADLENEKNQQQRSTKMSKRINWRSVISHYQLKAHAICSCQFKAQAIQQLI